MGDSRVDRDRLELIEEQRTLPPACEQTSMADIKNPRLIYLKGMLFLLAAIMSAGILLAFSPSLRTAALLAICVWCSCRFYYFALYVIEHYVDSNYCYAGLWAFVRYAWRERLGWRRDS